MKELNKVVFLHTPKTGGGAMEYFFYEQFKSNRNYFVYFLVWTTQDLIMMSW